MRKIFVFITCLFVAGTVFAVGENVPTSKSYVDSAIVLKQDNIPANAGAAQVLTNTGTPGNVNTKNIYDSSAAYAGQTDALVTAGTMNAAVQNAIETEFKCISWVDDDPSKECLLLELRAVPQQSILPTGYTALEYLESTGTQYIDTGIVPNQDYSMELVLQPTVLQSRIFAGTRHGDAQHNAFTINSGSNNQYYFMAFGNNGGVNSNLAGNVFVANLDTKKHTIKISKTGYTFDNATTQMQFGDFSSATSIYMFACNSQNIATLFSGVKIYNMKIWNQNNMVANFIPARRDSDGVLGMYNLVTNTFLTNSGTGDFVAGPVVYMPSGN